MRMLGGRRDRDVMLQTLDLLAGRAGSKEDRQRIEKLREAMAKSIEPVDAEEHSATKREISRLLERSAKAMTRLGSLGPKWEVVQPGLAGTFEGVAKRMKRAVKHGESLRFHRWRISLKRLGYQFEWLAPVWPKRLGKLAHRIGKLEKQLGELHDLAVLEETIEGRGAVFGGNRAVRAVIEGISTWSRKLRQSSKTNGRKIVRKLDEKFWRKLEQRWKAA
jgi:CHAD domain-containing protein